ncbi:MAG: hypothetical protein CMH54_06255 [Myxococcales bacterium]|nr:hypothetical protein [Myxococcales bacterium]
MNVIALDLDGTLEDSRTDMVAAVHRVREHFALDQRAADAIRPYVNKGMPTLYKVCFSELWDGEGDIPAKVKDAYESDYLNNVAVDTELYAGIAPALQQLQSLAPLALVTNKPEHISRRLLEALGVADHFSAVVGGDTCSESKPSIIPLQAAAEQCGYQPENGTVVMIGDSAGDIRMGRAFGATTLWCAWGYATEPGELQPDYQASNPEDLPGLVASILSR